MIVTPLLVTQLVVKQLVVTQIYHMGALVLKHHIFNIL